MTAVATAPVLASAMSRTSLRLIVELVGFRQRDPGRAVHATKDRGVIPGCEAGEDRGFLRIGGRKAGGLNLGRVGGLLPVIVQLQLRAVRVPQFQDRIL